MMTECRQRKIFCQIDFIVALPSHIAEGFFLCDNVRNPCHAVECKNIADRNLAAISSLMIGIYFSIFSPFSHAAFLEILALFYPPYFIITFFVVFAEFHSTFFYFQTNFASTFSR